MAAVLEIVLLVYMLPELLHPCTWPWEDVYGSYDHQLVILMSTDAAFQFLAILVIVLWFARYAAYEAKKTRVQIQRTSERERLDTIAKLWDAFGVTTKRLPVAVYICQVICIFLQFWMLKWLDPFVVGMVLAKLGISLLIVTAEWASPTALCCPSHWPEQTCRRPRRFQRHHQREAALVCALGVGILILLYALQYGSTFGSSDELFTRDQLFKMAADKHPFNADLHFRSKSDALAKQLQNDSLPFERQVLLVVLDGLGKNIVDSLAVRPFVDKLAKLGIQEDPNGLKAYLPSMSVPNWATLLSGVPPAWTGLRGNLFPGELQVDTLFSRARRLDRVVSAPPHGNRRGSNEWMTGMTGCPWWSALQATQFPRLRGDGTLPAYTMYDMRRKSLSLPGDFGWSILGNDEGTASTLAALKMEEPDDQEHSDDATDRNRVQIALEALQDTHDPFRFFLLHLSNIDTQAHEHGTESLEFQAAVNRSFTYVTDLLETLRAMSVPYETIVLITSDHGALEAGGHGGVDPSVIQVPLFVGPLRGRMPTPARDDDDYQDGQQLTLASVPTTIAALADLPVPRQTRGSILPMASKWMTATQRQNAKNDLFEAKRELTNVYLLQTRTSAYDWCRLAKQQPKLASRSKTLNATLADTYAFEKIMTSTEDDQLAASQSRDIVVAIYACSLFLFGIGGYVMRRSGALDFSCTAKSEACQENTKAFAVSLGLTIVYLVVVLGTVLGVYAYWGYPWDSTMVHSLTAAFRFLWIGLLPGTIMSILIHRSLYSVFLKWYACTNCTECCLNFGQCFCTEQAMVSTRGTRIRPSIHILAHLVPLYLMLLVFLLWSILLVIQGSFSFLVPLVYRNWFITETTWILRFRIGSIQLMCLPLLLGNLVHVGLWSASPPVNNFLPVALSRVSSEEVQPGKSASETGEHISDLFMGGPALPGPVGRVMGPTFEGVWSAVLP